MNVILVPGFWLSGASWGEVVPALLDAGHTVHTPTLRGLESIDADRREIGLAEHVQQIVDLVDDLDEADEVDDPVVLVGHSGGGAVVHSVADLRPKRIRRVIYVDSGPQPDGVPVNPSLAGDETGVPLPPWTEFDESDLGDLTAGQLERFRETAVPTPWGAANDGPRLTDERRFDVPITIVGTTFTRDEIEQAIAAGVPYFAEVPRIRDVTVVELPTGHWPQFTRPAELGRILADEAAR
ncbi:alpha/beta fold hydrolase [Cnuibacter sp. UC19_7]|uniref:alpha/beta fold hydrolase n=1 Tax=Cnuibacter sp. UC19_7 TaxID=3350166 RepID=UPI00366D6A2E